MDTYIITAKTVEEAYALANQKYADGAHEVSCEVIEMPKKGFLGIGSKEAKIKVTVTSSASADLNSVVSDVRNMKKYTDRGDTNNKKDKTDKPEKKSQNNQEGQNGQKKPSGQAQNQQQKKPNEQKKQPAPNGEKKPQNSQQGQNSQKKQDKPAQNQTKPAQQKNEPKPAEKAQRSALHNGAKPNTRQQIRHTPGEEVAGASVTVGTPMGLTDFVSEKKNDGFGSANRTSGTISNDIRKKKPAKPMLSADKADEKLLRSKYDMAETEDAYKNIESMISEDEELLEKEAGAALGFAPEEETIPTAAPRKKEAVTQAEMNYALEFANTLLQNMNIEAHAVQCECPEGEEFEVNGEANVYPKIEIVGDDTGILIGHHGETLDAIQYLVNLCALRKTKSKDGDYVKIVVDIENYREKRAATLKALARRMAAKAVKYKRNVFLEPMNAYERRIIHSELQNYPDVSTHSVGTDKDRKIIITYEGEDKQPDNRQHRRRNGNGQHSNGSKGGAKQVEKSGESEVSAEHRRPRKIQKVSIEQLDDILEGDTTLLDGSKQ